MNSYDTTVKVLKALGHPLRLKIVVGLAKEPQCVKDIWGCLGLPQAVISQHLAMLRTSGIIEGRRHGVEMHYTVTDPLAKVIIDFIEQN
ncbi:MAG: metalloregulator ArsR/SmtB family transcription factor [Geobacteraceae bacterium]|nr:metalloregulator ArsR/SmtB family transcription factor [Geobacteraceae bacterium]